MMEVWSANVLYAGHEVYLPRGSSPARREDHGGRDGHPKTQTSFSEQATVQRWMRYPFGAGRASKLAKT
jgi:hypothetical protein